MSASSPTCGPLPWVTTSWWCRVDPSEDARRGAGRPGLVGGLERLSPSQESVAAERDDRTRPVLAVRGWVGCARSPVGGNFGGGGHPVAL